MKQKVFSWGDKFQIWDENQTPRYQVEGEVWSLGKRLHVLGLDGAELAFVCQKVWSFLTRFFVEIQGETVCEVVKEFTFFRPSYHIEGLGWRIGGEIWEHEYVVYDANGRTVMALSKEWFTWGDSYCLRIEDGQDELLCLCAALAIDAAVDVQSSNN